MRWLIAIAVIFGWCSWSSGAYAIGEWCAPIKLLYASAPDSSMRDWVLKLRERTIGTIDSDARFEIYETSQGIVPIAEIVPGLKNGNLAIAVVPVQFLSKSFPGLTVLNFPGLVPDTASIDLLYRGQRYLASIDTEMGDHDLAMLGIAHYPYTLFYRGTHIASLKDLKGKKIHTSSFGQGATIRALGASPIWSPVGETYAALQKGTVDGAFLPLGGLAYKSVPKLFSAIVSPPYSTKLVMVGSLKFLNRAKKEIVKRFVVTAREISLKHSAQIESGIMSTVEGFKKVGIVAKYYSTEELAKIGHVDYEMLWSRLAKQRGATAPLLLQAIKADLRK